MAETYRNQNVEIIDYFRYAYDSRNALRSLFEGWRWSSGKFEFKEEWRIEDLNTSDTDQHRTMRELTKAMSY